MKTGKERKGKLEAHKDSDGITREREEKNKSEKPEGQGLSGKAVALTA